MDDPTVDRFEPQNPPLVARRLLRCVNQALDSQDRYLARMLRAAMRSRGNLRIYGAFNRDPDTGEPAGDTLTYVVDVRLPTTGWVQLCTIHWTQLGLEVADVKAALERHKRAHGDGSGPLS